MSAFFDDSQKRRELSTRPPRLLEASEPIDTLDKSTFRGTRTVGRSSLGQGKKLLYNSLHQLLLRDTHEALVPKG